MPQGFSLGEHSLCMLVLMSFVSITFGTEKNSELKKLDSESHPFPLVAESEQTAVEYYGLDGDVRQLTYTIRGFDTEKIDIRDEEYYKIGLAGESNLMEKGEPELPMLARSLIIPDDKMMDITVSGGEYVEYDSISIVPSKGNLLRSEYPDPSRVPYEFGKVYGVDGWYPKDIARLRDPYIVRDFRGQVVEFYPFQYHPTDNKLRVYTQVDVEISPVGYGGENVFHRTRSLDTVQRDFAQSYERRFINYQEELNQLRYTPVEEEGNMLVISDDDFESEMTSFVDWKNSRGLPTELVPLSEVGSTSTDIDNYIENYYYDNGLTFVLLVGDENRIPSLTYSSEYSDPSYSFIEGDDCYPEIFIGRFSADTIDHVQTMVDRSLYYEQNSGQDWRTKATGIASDEGSDPADWEHMRMLRDRLYDYDYTWVDEFYDGSHGEDDADGNPTSAMVTDAFNEGRHIANYCGHGLETSIATSGFSTTDINGLTNPYMHAFFILVACQVGSFDYGECFAEAWIRATDGNGDPTGGIAAFGSTKNQAWVPPMTAQDEMMHLYTESYMDNVKTTTGGIAFNGCMHMNDEHGTDGDDETATWHLLGDPSLIITGEVIPPGDPPEITVTRPDGGEIFDADTSEEITWTTITGDDPIDHVDLWYSVNAGSSWNSIADGLADTGSYTWTVPNEDSSDCLVRARVYDTQGRYGENTSDTVFTIAGTPPSTPQNLFVEHYGQSVQTLFDDDVEGGDLGYTTEVSHAEASDWAIRNNGASSGTNSWDWGDGAFNKDSNNGMLSSLISPEISIPSNADDEYGVNLTFQHWRDFGDTYQYDAGNVKISTNGVDFTLITPEEGYDGTVPTSWDNPLGGEEAWGGSSDWTTATFNLTAYIGETVYIRWDAGTEAYDGFEGAGWRIDDIYIEGLILDEEGTDHNLVTWDASSDDPSEVSHYNIYRSEFTDGPWDGTALIDSVTADGSVNYSYVDENKGMADEIYWWYVVRAVGTNGLEEENVNSMQEPGAGMDVFNIDIYQGGDAKGWNFVSFNIEPSDTTLETILSGIDGSYDKVMYYSSRRIGDERISKWLSYSTGRQDHYNDLSHWNHTMGLWIHATADATLTVEGYAPSTTDITLHPGWNMVGYPSDTGATASSTLPNQVTKVGVFDALQEYNINYVSDLSSVTMNAGNGYWVYNDADEPVIWTVTY